MYTYLSRGAGEYGLMPRTNPQSMTEGVSTRPQLGGSAGTAGSRTAKSRPSKPAIIDFNRKTEICRNWQQGRCAYGDRCAYAHGKNELKLPTLRSMETSGRIADATKYRCHPCMTWVATGSCPYGRRCVFIHDPRVEGPEEALSLSKVPRQGTRGAIVATCPSGDTCFFFPDIVRDIDSTEVPTHLARYDLDAPTGDISEVGCRTVRSLWRSFLSVFENASLGVTGDTDNDDGALERSRSDVARYGSGNPSARSCHTCSAAAAAGGHGKKNAPATAEGGILSDGGGPASDGIVAHSFPYPIPSTYASVAAAAGVAGAGETSAGDTFGDAPGAVRGGALLSPFSKRGTPLSVAADGFEFRRSRAYETHLPVFEGLRRGVPASPPPTPGNSTGNIPGTGCVEASDDGHTPPYPPGGPATSTPSSRAIPPLQPTIRDIVHDENGSVTSGGSDSSSDSSSSNYSIGTGNASGSSPSDSSSCVTSSYATCFSAFESSSAWQVADLADDDSTSVVSSIAQHQGRLVCPLPGLASMANGWTTDRVERGTSYFSLAYHLGCINRNDDSRGSGSRIVDHQQQREVHHLQQQRSHRDSICSDQSASPSTTASLCSSPANSWTSGGSAVGSSDDTNAGSQVSSLASSDLDTNGGGSSGSSSSVATMMASIESFSGIARLTKQQEQQRQPQQQEQEPASDATSNGDTMPPSSRVATAGWFGVFANRDNGDESSRSSAFSTALDHHAQVLNTRGGITVGRILSTTSMSHVPPL